MANKVSTDKIIIEPIQTATASITVGMASKMGYISHRLDPSVVTEFTKRERGETGRKKLRSLDDEYESCFYYTNDDEYGVPVGAFFKGMLDAATDLSIAKTQIKRAVRLLGDIVPLRYDKVIRREDLVKRAGINGTPDIRHRPEFMEWECDIHILYDVNVITLDTIANLIDRAGFTSGIGDWRPSSPKSPGTFGMYAVKLTIDN